MMARIKMVMEIWTIWF